MPGWKQKVEELFGQRVTTSPPTSDEEIAELAEWLGTDLPDNLAEFLKESNGVCDSDQDWVWRVASAEEMQSDTEEFREDEAEIYLDDNTWDEVQADPDLLEEYEDHISFDHYLFLSAWQGTGDRFAILLKPAADTPAGHIVHWKRETATFTPFAQNLDGYLTKMQSLVCD